MTTHRFDPVSLLLGVITVVGGVAATNSRLGRLVNDRPDALLPIIVLAVGVVAIAVAARRLVGNRQLPERDDAH